MEKWENESVLFEIEDGILIGTYKTQVVDLALAMDITEKRNSFTRERRLPVLVDYRNVNFTTKEARDYFANDKLASRNIIAMAILINSPVGKIITSFFLKLSKPDYHIKVFNHKGKAFSWLSQYK